MFLLFRITFPFCGTRQYKTPVQEQTCWLCTQWLPMLTQIGCAENKADWWNSGQITGIAWRADDRYLLKTIFIFE